MLIGRQARQKTVLGGKGDAATVHCCLQVRKVASTSRLSARNSLVAARQKSVPTLDLPRTAVITAPRSFSLCCAPTAICGSQLSWS
jgi:hypothetical protein